MRRAATGLATAVLGGVLAWAAPAPPAAAHQAAEDDQGIELLVYSDPQLSWWRGGQADGCTSDRQEVIDPVLVGAVEPSCVDLKGQESNQNLVTAMNKVKNGELTWPSSSGLPGTTVAPSFAIVNGDLLSTGHRYEQRWYDEIYGDPDGTSPGKLELKRYEGLGNHDYQNDAHSCDYADLSIVGIIESLRVETYAPDSSRCAKEAVWRIARTLESRNDEVSYDFPSYISLESGGAYNAELIVRYSLHRPGYNPQPVSQPSGHIPAGQSRQIIVPANARNVSIEITAPTTDRTIRTVTVSEGDHQMRRQCWKTAGALLTPSASQVDCPEEWPNVSGSLAYSWEVGNYHFVQLHNRPGYTVDLPESQLAFGPLDAPFGRLGWSPRVNITDGFDWLEDDLYDATLRGKHIILNMHDDDLDEPNARFRQIIQGKDVRAIFSGHIHHTAGARAQTINNSFWDIPVWRSGSAECLTFLAVDLHDDYMNIGVVETDMGANPGVRFRTTPEACDTFGNYSNVEVVRTVDHVVFNHAPHGCCINYAYRPFPVYEDAPATFSAMAFVDNLDGDPLGELLTYEWDMDDDGEYDDGHGVGWTQTQNTWTFTTSGTHTIRVRVTDPKGASAFAEAEVEVEEVDDFAEVGTASLTATEDEILEFPLPITDEEGDELRCTINEPPSHGEATVAGDCSGGTYLPDGDDPKPDAFMFLVRDTAGNIQGEGTIYLAVRPVNDPPTWDTTSAKAHTSVEDSGPVVVPNWLTGLSVGPTDEQRTQTLFLSTGVVSGGGMFSSAPRVDPDGTLRYTPAPNAFGEAEIEVTLRDSGGTAIGGDDTTTLTSTITITNVNDPPTANFWGDLELPEGTQEALAADVADIDNERFELSYEWDMDGDGELDDSTDRAPLFFEGDDADHPITVRVTDPGGLSATATTRLIITNEAPELTATVDDGPVLEGGEATITASAWDPGWLDVLEFAVDCDDDGTYGPFSASTELACPFDQHGTFTIRAAVRDDDGGVDEQELEVVVGNVAPTASADGPAEALWGDAVTFIATATDPSPVDQAALTYDWDLHGDGTWERLDAEATVSTAYPTTGTRTIGVRVCDDATCTVATHTIQVGSHATALTMEPLALALLKATGTISAVLVDQHTGEPVAGETVTFRSATRGTDYCTAVTDAAGRASCGRSVLQAALAGLQFTGTYGGSSQYDGSSATTQGLSLNLGLL